MPASTWRRTTSATWRGHAGVEGGRVIRLAALAGEEEVDHGLAARQAADMGGEEVAHVLARCRPARTSVCG